MSFYIPQEGSAASCYRSGVQYGEIVEVIQRRCSSRTRLLPCPLFLLQVQFPAGSLTHPLCSTTGVMVQSSRTRCSYSARSLTRPLCTTTGVMVQTVQFLDKVVAMPLLLRQVHRFQTCVHVWRYRRCSSASRNGCPSLCNDRCWLVDPDSAYVLFLDMVVLPVVMQDRFSGLEVQKTVGFPQLQFLTVVVAMPVEIPQAQFLDKVYMSIVVSGADGQTAQKTVEYPQLQFLDKVFIPVVVVSGADGQTVQKTVEYPQLQFLDKVFSRRFCLVPMARQRRNCGDSTVAVLGQGVHACFWSGADDQTVQKPVEFPQVQFLDKVDMPVVCMTGAWFSQHFFCELTGVRTRGLGEWR